MSKCFVFYQVLVGTNTQWVTSVDGVIPPNAIPGGNSEDGETLYIGRAQHEGTTPIGKVSYLSENQKHIG